MVDLRNVTWASIPALASVLYEQGGLEPADLQEVESMGVENDVSNGESDELQSDRQKSAVDEEDDEDEDSYFLLLLISRHLGRLLR